MGVPQGRSSIHGRAGVGADGLAHPPALGHAQPMSTRPPGWATLPAPRSGRRHGRGSLPSHAHTDPPSTPRPVPHTPQRIFHVCCLFTQKNEMIKLN